MRVIYDPRDQLNLQDYGIFVPVSKDNRKKTMEVLLGSAGVLSPPQWWIQSLGTSLTKEDLLRVHTPRLVDALFSGGKALETELVRTFELILPDGSYNRYDPAKAVKPLSDLFDVLLHRGGGTYEACIQALDCGAGFFLGGGYHHAMADWGSGFCVFNDAVVAMKKLQAQGLISHGWIVDIDAHKGDGTAALTLKDPTITTLSIHMAQGWPLDVSVQEAANQPGRSELSFEPSTLDIPVEEPDQDRYVELLDRGLHRLWEARQGVGTGSVQDLRGNLRPVVNPDLVFVVMGSDPFEEDELPSAKLLHLTREQMHQRDVLVHSFFRERGVPVAYNMAGNYGENGWKIYSDFLAWALAY